MNDLYKRALDLRRTLDSLITRHGTWDTEWQADDAIVAAFRKVLEDHAAKN